MSDDFYLTLPSHSNRNEFPQNQSNHFKIRLPHPKRLEGSGWKVGLSSISLPDAIIELPKLMDAKEILFIMDWAVTFPSNTTKFGRAWYNPKDPDIVLEYDNGVDFMKSVINYFEQRRIDSFGGPTFGAKYITEDGKRTYIKFRWDGSDLLTDNEATQVHSKYPNAFKINRTLALKMGWLKETTPENYVLGPNLRQEFFTDLVPDLKNMTHDLGDGHELGHGKDKPAFWMVDQGLLTLSVTCNWRFMNLNQAFEAVAGTRSRSLFVYSDVGGSSVVGNQVTDLLSIFVAKKKGFSISNLCTFNIFHYASRCWTLSRRKWQRPQVIWRDLVKEIRSSLYISNEHERWKFDALQTRRTIGQWLYSRFHPCQCPRRMERFKNGWTIGITQHSRRYSRYQERW